MCASKSCASCQPEGVCQPKPVLSKRGKPPRTKSAFVASTRAAMGFSQSQLAKVLGISSKAVQSYEQGWRPVPGSILLHLLVLLDDIRARSGEVRQPCWEINQCPPEALTSCPVAKMGTGLRCWALANERCRVLGGRGGETIFREMDCPVISQLTAGI